MKQLSTQAKKAEKYKQLKNEIKTRKTKIQKGEQNVLFFTYNNLKKDQETLKADIKAGERKTHSAGELIAGEKHELKQTEQQITKTQAQIELTKQTEMKKKVEEARLTDKIKAFEMIKTIKIKKTQLEQEEKHFKKELLESQNFLNKKEDITQSQKSFNISQTYLENLSQDKKAAEVLTDSLKKQIEFIDKEIQFLNHENQNLEKQKQNIENEIAKTKDFLKKANKTALTLNHDKEIFLNELKTAEAQKKESEETLNLLKQNLFVLQHKIEEIKKLISRFSNFNKAADELCEFKSKEFKSLFHNVEIDQGWQKALGAVLAKHIQALIPNENASIQQAVSWLKTNSKGKVCFLSSLPSPIISNHLKQEIKAYPAFVCFLDEKVTWDPALKPKPCFLQDTVVVSNLESAFELKKRFPVFQFVTKEGDIVTRDSFVYAGSSDKETGLLEIRHQAETYAKELSAKEIELKIKTLEFNTRNKTWDKMCKQQETLDHQMAKNSSHLITLEKDIEQMEKDILRLLEIKKSKNLKITSFNKEKQNLLQHKSFAKKEAQNLNQKLLKEEAKLSSLKTAIQGYKSQEAKVTEWDKKLQENQNHQENLSKEIALLSRLIEWPKNKDLKQDKDLNFNNEIQSIKQTRSKLNEDLIAFQKKLDEQKQLKAKQEQNIKNIEERAYQIKLERSDLDLKWDKKELEKTHIKDKFLSDYELPIEEFKPLTEEIPLQTLKQEILVYEKQIDRIGGINFLALEDYEKLNQDNLFLKNQKEDLIRSKTQIIKVISHIDRLCETRFNTMLDEINKRLSKVFPIVFQGDDAKAELVLYQEKENQDPGLDIIIQPPGKKPQSVNLLSRGEKALTSLCLIYSLFLVKPSPFCIIDEVDAPLDDANIFRFISILKEMATKSQIIAISHNKYTMQACKKLYGVTMARPGISQMVSVDMEKASKELNL